MRQAMRSKETTRVNNINYKMTPINSGFNCIRIYLSAVELPRRSFAAVARIRSIPRGSSPLRVIPKPNSNSCMKPATLPSDRPTSRMELLWRVLEVAVSQHDAYKELKVYLDDSRSLSSSTTYWSKAF